MKFRFLGLTTADFDRWVQKNKAEKAELTRDAYLELDKPSERVPVRRYGAVASDLFDAIVNRCVDRNKLCMRHMAMSAREHRASVPAAASDPIGLNLAFEPAMCTADGSLGSALSSPVYRN
jgi:uncharacterized HAD superfamily protein